MDDVNLPEQPVWGREEFPHRAVQRKTVRVEAFTTDPWVTVQQVPQHYPQDARRIRGHGQGEDGNRTQPPVSLASQPSEPDPSPCCLETVPAPIAARERRMRRACNSCWAPLESALSACLYSPHQCADNAGNWSISRRS